MATIKQGDDDTIYIAGDFYEGPLAPGDYLAKWTWNGRSQFDVDDDEPTSDRIRCEYCGTLNPGDAYQCIGCQHSM